MPIFPAVRSRDLLYMGKAGTIVCALFPSTWRTLSPDVYLLGGHFGPEKKKFSPPSPPKFPNSPQTPFQPLGPSRSPPPPFLDFQKKPVPSPSPGASDSLFSPPGAEKKYPKRSPSLPGVGTHANTQNLPHFRAFPAGIQEHSLKRQAMSLLRLPSPKQSRQ